MYSNSNSFGNSGTQVGAPPVFPKPLQGPRLVPPAVTR